MTPAPRVGLPLPGLLLGCALIVSSSCTAGQGDDITPESTLASSLTSSQRRARAAQIREAAAREGLTRAGWLLAGIADAETQLSHCWSELTWACQGPYSADCQGPVVAGAGDGPCRDRQGGLGMFQFDGGNFDETLRRDGVRVLSVAGNVQAAVEFVLQMVVDSAYIGGVSSRAEAVAWLNGVTPEHSRFHPWVQTVTHYYNGCRPGFSCYPQRYQHYRDNARGIWSEMGPGFWNAPPAPSPSPSPPAAAGAQAIEVYWARQADGAYDLRALAPPAIVRVEYLVDGWRIGAATRAEGSNFPIRYRFHEATDERLLEVRGYDAGGRAVGLGEGLLDVTEGVGVYIKQMGAALYEIGLERAPADVASVEVRADGFLLTDDVSGLPRSPRRAVRSRFLQLGPRQFEIRTFHVDGSLRGVLRRSFTLRHAAPTAPPVAAPAEGRVLSATPYRYQYANANDPSGTCGVTSASMVLGHHGIHATPDQLFVRHGVAQGQSPAALAALYRMYGLYAASTYAGTFAQVRAYLDAGLPVVVHGDFTPSGHIVVVVGYDRDGFIVHDPSGRWDGALRGSYAGRTDTNGRFVRYSLASLERVIGPSGDVWLSVASRSPL
jgi:hypothetical protein